MSIVLGIDTSSTDLSVGICLDNRPLASFCRFIRNSHAEHIASSISTLLSAADIEASSIDRIAIAVGPGSFTGLRIGIAFLKGFCVGKPVRVLPLSSLLILAHAARYHNGRVVAAIDARNNNVYWASFAASGGRITRISADTVTPAEPFTSMLLKEDVVVTDTIGYKGSTVFSVLNGSFPVLPIEDHPLHRGLISALQGAEALNEPAQWCDATSIRPNYLRRSIPEERRSRGCIA